MKEYSLGLGARRIFPTEGRMESGRRTTGGPRMELRRRSGAKPKKPKTYFENKILKHCSCIRRHSSIGIVLHFASPSSHYLIINISDIWTLQHFHFPREGKYPLLPLHVGAHDGGIFAIYFHETSSK